MTKTNDTTIAEQLAALVHRQLGLSQHRRDNWSSADRDTTRYQFADGSTIVVSCGYGATETMTRMLEDSRQHFETRDVAATDTCGRMVLIVDRWGNELRNEPYDYELEAFENHREAARLYIDSINGCWGCVGTRLNTDRSRVIWVTVPNPTWWEHLVAEKKS